MPSQFAADRHTVQEYLGRSDRVAFCAVMVGTPFPFTMLQYVDVGNLTEIKEIARCHSHRFSIVSVTDDDGANVPCRTGYKWVAAFPIGG